jgi:hypothetical protein
VRIRVVNLKNTSSYLVKILFLIVISITLAVSGKFLYGKSNKSNKSNGALNTNSRLKLNSTKLPKILNKEITILDVISQKFSQSKTSKDKVSKKNTKILNQSKYSKSIINSEFELIKFASSTKFDINIANEKNNNSANEESKNNSESLQDMQEAESRLNSRNAVKN